jgi:hypothetical protein
MPYALYEGAWKRRATRQLGSSLDAERDPAHAESSSDPNGGPISWISSMLSPLLPDEMIGDQYLQLPITSTVQDYDVDSHSYGIAPGSGNTVQVSQHISTEAHSVDRGSFAALKYTPAGDRTGVYAVSEVSDSGAPGTPSGFADDRYNQGVGAPSDPFARIGKRITRIRDMFIDMHRFEPEMRASVTRNAYSAPAAPAGSGQYLSPFPTLVSSGAGGIGTPDQMVWPERRKTPTGWSEDSEQLATPNAFGLSQWGL